MGSEHILVDLQQSNWYVLFVRSNQEKRIALRLNNSGIEHLLPCYTSKRQWKDRRVRLEVPLFPGYLFVRLPLKDRMKVLTVPNVVCLVGTKNCPSVISESEIEFITRSTAAHKATPHPYLQAGQRVVVTDGALAGLEGFVLRQHKGRRVIVSLESIERSFAVDIDNSSVEPVGEMCLDMALRYYVQQHLQKG